MIEEVLHDSSEFELRDCREELERLRSAGELVWSDLDSLLSGKFLRTIPGVQPCDGFFAAVVERRGQGARGLGASQSHYFHKA